MQTMFMSVPSGYRTVNFPDPDCEALPGLRWGRFDELLSAAYWKGQAEQAEALGLRRRLRLGSDLLEETAACLLGGYGIRGELGVLAFRRLRDLGILKRVTQADEIEAHLAEPFVMKDGLNVRYRFPRQKARYLEAMIVTLRTFEEPENDVVLRDALTTIPGVGLKTASWIVRNHRTSDFVAVLDVHIMRACKHLGIFPARSNPQRSYRELEEKFLKFASAIDVPASLLDAVMWRHMRLITH